jgi:hypothetical protein|nr:MAG: hypothetical protein [Bacteriophage sp.]
MKKAAFHGCFSSFLTYSRYNITPFLRAMGGNKAPKRAITGNVL